MTAQKAILALAVLVFDEEEQVAVVLLLVQQRELCLRKARVIASKGEELPMTVVADVEGVTGAHNSTIPTTSGWPNLHMEACANGFERAFEMFEFHRRMIESSSVLFARKRARWTDVTAIFQTWMTPAGRCAG
jgi:hypothetical protein